MNEIKFTSVGMENQSLSELLQVVNRKKVIVNR